MNDQDHDLSLGDDHFLRYFRCAPDDLPANRELYGTPLPRVEKAGAIVRHKRADTGEWCESAIHFDIPEMLLARDEQAQWKVESWEPLTLSPSLLCRRCGDHGFIKSGRWVRA